VLLAIGIQQRADKRVTVSGHEIHGNGSFLARPASRQSREGSYGAPLVTTYLFLD
jgi:hypothetical protein